MIGNKIEELRDKLYEKINSNCDYETIVKLSQELDRLINSYYIDFYIMKGKENRNIIEH
ncbi:aspartyl-phosphate phosphatase Spo0E family protein [Caloramator sp. Dgby_cultured_2]|uniref:aspartyl-phosphate phosphatase Spo0E family protein n=1 Tax=Caloramator sp. Dgby_cultured_2 TaxID=3029174 RepID=UPI00237D7D64|nr:aspartyl-phosphate phosphatase Spo0E family protein [Caloramator sp. Dgby_cultured_2]WDU84484.1 aspartyl-phosphate phosphatase Spo0E family protein [Caloramator sp. Dgby_cultured_2]